MDAVSGAAATVELVSGIVAMTSGVVAAAVAAVVAGIVSACGVAVAVHGNQAVHMVAGQ